MRRPFRLAMQPAHITLERDDQAQMPLSKHELGAVSILVGGRPTTRRLKLIRDLLAQLYRELSETFHVKLRGILRGPWRWKLMQHIQHSLLKDHDMTLVTAF